MPICLPLKPMDSIFDSTYQYEKNGLNDAALQASQIHISAQVLVFGKRLYYNEL